MCARSTSTAQGRPSMTTYGSLDDFLREAGVSPADVDALRAALITERACRSGDDHRDEPNHHGGKRSRQLDAHRQRHALDRMYGRRPRPPVILPAHDSARYTPSTNPITSPNTGTTKNPTMPSAPPTSRVDVGTSARRIRRTGHRYLTAVVGTHHHRDDRQRHPRRDGVLDGRPHRIAAYTNSIPGSSGTTMPTSPTAIASATSRTRRRRLIRQTILYGSHKLSSLPSALHARRSSRLQHQLAQHPTVGQQLQRLRAPSTADTAPAAAV